MAGPESPRFPSPTWSRGGGRPSACRLRRNGNRGTARRGSGGSWIEELRLIRRQVRGLGQERDREENREGAAHQRFYHAVNWAELLSCDSREPIRSLQMLCTGSGRGTQRNAKCRCGLSSSTIPTSGRRSFVFKIDRDVWRSPFPSGVGPLAGPQEYGDLHIGDFIGRMEPGSLFLNGPNVPHALHPAEADELEPARAGGAPVFREDLGGRSSGPGGNGNGGAVPR